MKNLIIILTLILLVFNSCNKKNELPTYETTTEYYDTGEIYRIVEKRSDHEQYWRGYFPNGTLHVEGMMRDSLKDGVWKVYYSDGVLRNEAIFFNDIFVKDIVGYPITLDFKGNPTEIKVGHSYSFRILNAGAFTIHTPVKIPKEYQRIEDENNPYTHLFTPQKAGTDTIMIVTNIYNKGVKNDSIFFPITIVE